MQAWPDFDVKCVGEWSFKLTLLKLKWLQWREWLLLSQSLRMLPCYGWNSKCFFPFFLFCWLVPSPFLLVACIIRGLRGLEPDGHGLNPGSTITQWLWPWINVILINLKLIQNLIPVRVSCDRHHKLPQTRCFRTTEFYYLSFLWGPNRCHWVEKPSCWPGCASSGGSRGGSSPGLLQLWRLPYSPGSASELTPPSPPLPV